MANLIVGAIVVGAVGAAVAFLVKEKKRGVTCIGCSQAGLCARKHGDRCRSCGEDAGDYERDGKN